MVEGAQGPIHQCGRLRPFRLGAHRADPPSRRVGYLWTEANDAGAAPVRELAARGAATLARCVADQKAASFHTSYAVRVNTMKAITM